MQFTSWGQGTAAPAPVSTNAISIAPFKLNLGVEASQQPQDVDSAIKILFAITLLTLAPSIILLMKPRLGRPVRWSRSASRLNPIVVS